MIHSQNTEKTSIFWSSTQSCKIWNSWSRRNKWNRELYLTLHRWLHPRVWPVYITQNQKKKLVLKWFFGRGSQNIIHIVRNNQNILFNTIRGGLTPISNFICWIEKLQKAEKIKRAKIKQTYFSLPSCKRIFCSHCFTVSWNNELYVRLEC